MKTMNAVKPVFLTFLLTLLLSFLASCFHSKQEPIIYDLLTEGTFTKGMEGPAVDALGNLYAVNYGQQGTIGIVTPEGEHSLYISLPTGSIGNGIRFDNIGRMYIADYTGHNILRITSTKDTLAENSSHSTNNFIEVFAHDSLMNQPNDIAISSVSQFIYASDPNWKDSTGMLWMADTSGVFHLLEKEMGTTNGIEVSPCGKFLYVNESIQRNIWIYNIDQSNIPTNKRLFYSFEDFGMDGMRCDKEGNLFVTRHGKGTVVKLSPKGTLLAEYILKGKLPSNLTFNNNYTKIYVTLADRGCFEVISLR